MILPDINLLVYAVNSAASEHRAAREWWEGQINSGVEIALAWTTVLGFIRICTSKTLLRPLEPEEAVERVDAWLRRPNVHVASPGGAHWGIFSRLVREHRLVSNSLTDAHLAALAIEYDLELCSNDEGFRRFEGLRWSNPLRVTA